MKDVRQKAVAGHPASLRRVFIAMAVLTAYMAVSTVALHRQTMDDDLRDTLELANYIVAIVALGLSYYFLVIRPTAAWEKKNSAAQARLAQLSEAIENMSDAFYALDGEDRFTYANAKAVAVYRKPHEQLMGQPLWNHTTADASVRAKIRGFLEQARATQQVQRVRVGVPELGAWYELTGYPRGGDVSIFFQEITQRHHAEEHLRRLSVAVEGMTDGFFTLDNDWCFAFVNGVMAEAFGKPAADLLGKPVWDYVLPEVRDDLRKFYEAAKASQKVTRSEVFLPALNMWTENSIYPDRNGVAIFVQDTTQRHLTEQRLAHKTRAQTALAQFSAFAFTTEDLSAILKHAGQTARRILSVDYAVAYEVDTGTGNVRVTVDSGDLPTIGLPQKLAEYTQGGLLRYVMDRGETLVFADSDNETRFTLGPLLKSHGVRAGIIVAPALQGAVSIFSVFSREVRAFNADEIEFAQALGRMVAVLVERDRTLDGLRLRERALEAVTQGIIITVIDDIGGDAPIIYANSAFAAITGYARDELIGKSSYDFSAPDSNRMEVAGARNIVKQRGHIRYEVETLRKDGSSFVNRYSASPVPDRDGKLTRYVTVNEDITEERKRDARLAEMQKMESVGQLTGGIAHEFNNLLTIVRGNAEDLRDELTGLQQKQADMVMQAADRGASLVRQLLAFSRKQEIKPTVVNLNSALQQFEKLLRRALEERVNVDIRPGANIPPVKVDLGQLENALLNLALNARDAMPDGSTVTIETMTSVLDDDYVKANPEVRPGTYVMIAITDSGAGMTRDVAAKAFQPFFTTKGVGEGTGLGLSMVYGFVKQSEGHVKIYSEVGLGTTVKLYFPPAADAFGEQVPQNTDSDRPAGTGRILMVEDDDLVRQSVETKLLRLGYTVTAVSAAAEALTVLESDPHFDLLFTDVIMPGAMTGADLARDVAQRWPNIRVLMTSGYTEATVLGKVKMPDAVRLLSKPYSNIDLADAITTVLRDGGGPKAQVA